MLRRLPLFSSLITAFILLFIAMPAFAQDTPPANPNANIQFPLPVYTLRGEVPIVGTANLPRLNGYFIEYRELQADLSVSEDAVWFPAALRRTTPVENGLLGTWDTTSLLDGLYELRLTVGQTGGSRVTQIVSPLRVENIPSDDPIVAEYLTNITIVPVEATPTPTPAVSRNPRVSANARFVNVRTGDSTAYAIIATLQQDEEVPVVGISARGTGWYQVRLPDNRLGWVSPTVVNEVGDFTGVPFVQPPPPPTATPTPIPSATPIPTLTPIPSPTSASNANLVAGIVVLEPAVPVCAQTFNVGFDVANLGTTQTLAPGVVSLTDARAADGSVQQTTVGGFPVLQPGQTFRVNIPLTVSTFYNETHRITLTIDSGNAIPEQNEADNTRQVDYTLTQGSCP